MGIVDFFKHRRIITEEEAERLRGGDDINKPTQRKGITVAEVLAVFPGAKVCPRKFEAEQWLEAMGVLEADRQAILEEAARWTLKDGSWQRTEEDLKGPYRCRRCVENKHAKVVRRTWSDESWDWCCHRCGRKVKS